MSSVAVSAHRGISAPARDTAWRLTSLLSPRPTARVAVPDITGELLNEYAGSRRLDLSAPDAPWAMYLADAEGTFHYLAFDLDAKGRNGRARAAEGAQRVAALCEAAGLSPVVCQSGPSGGRHVWVGLAEAVDAGAVALLARLARRVCDCLDIAPLTNPRTGCVRPPGSPHRHGGTSEVISGALDALTTPRGTREQVHLLIAELETAAGLPSATSTASTSGTGGTGGTGLGGPIPVDAHGHTYLPGPRRPLPAGSSQALHQDATDGTDASAVLWRVLIGAAAAHWRYADIAALADQAPGLEHVRTRREGSARSPRDPSQMRAVLAHQWARAVRHVATSPRQIGDDPTFEPRAAALAEHVQTLQERADASVGRWASTTGAMDRRVFDTLCLFSLQAMNPTVEADVRRLAMHAGIGRTSAAKALHRLSAHGWIVRTQASEGARAAFWSIDPQDVIHTSPDQARTQADSRPLATGSTHRGLLTVTLTERLNAGAHDLFTQDGLGVLAGNVYARLSETFQSLHTLARQLGLSLSLLRTLLERLTEEGLILQHAQGWRRPARDARARLAGLKGLTGALARRARLYRQERAMWAWWQSEQAWMAAPRSQQAVRPLTSLTPAAETTRLGRYPRHRHSGRADHHAARRHLAGLPDPPPELETAA